MVRGWDPKLSRPRVVQEKPWKALVEAFIIGGDEEEKAGVAAGAHWERDSVGPGVEFS